MIRYFSIRILHFFKSFLTTAKLCSIVCSGVQAMTIRQVIQIELQRRGWSHYRLAKEMEGRMPARTVYAYLSGECDLVSERVSIILKVLELELVPRKIIKKVRVK